MTQQATDEVLLTIGQLARRTGVSARTIRFWSDEGLVPPSERSHGGYRLYDAVAVARLDLVRTLRDLGMGLEEVRAVLARQREVHEVAAAQVRAIDARIRALRVQRAVCTLLAAGPPGNGLDYEKVKLMNDLARLSAAERQRMIDEFVDAVFTDVPPDAPGAGIAQGMRSLPAELPDEPSPEQVQAWIELAELVQDASFRARVQQMAVAGATQPAEGPDFDPAAVQREAGTAVASGVEPTSAQARDVLARLGLAALPTADRTALADRIETFTDPRVERYWALLAVLNGWPERPSSSPAFIWLVAALRG